MPVAITRRQFEFAACRFEILALEWDWVDFENQRVVGPDSNIGGMTSRHIGFILKS